VNLAETLRGLIRRWYITFPGIVLAIAAAITAWMVVPVQYERSATQFLLPGPASMPENSNPFLYLGGLSYATDVVVRALGSENVINEVNEQHPGVTLVVARDTSTSGPVVLTTVTATDDTEAGEVLQDIVGRTAGVLNDLQDVEAIPVDNRITAITLTVDDKGTVNQRNRLVATAGAGIGILALTLVIASLVDGVTRQRRRRAEADDADHGDDEASETTEAQDGAFEEDADLFTREIPIVGSVKSARPADGGGAGVATEEDLGTPAHASGRKVRRGRVDDDPSQ
jgi:hypothetical protein